mmetsp:Transcript_42920/g.103866  ORF Transcript_42920/g.103866 Transcript_42920/m.103866 type:complete len:88 (+) Transcript_42920:626-889(+)
MQSFIGNNNTINHTSGGPSNTTHNDPQTMRPPIDSVFLLYKRTNYIELAISVTSTNTNWPQQQQQAMVFQDFVPHIHSLQRQTLDNI